MTDRLDREIRAGMICERIASQAVNAYGYVIRSERHVDEDDDESYGDAALVCINEIRRMADALQEIVEDGDE